MNNDNMTILVCFINFKELQDTFDLYISIRLRFINSLKLFSLVVMNLVKSFISVYYLVFKKKRMCIHYQIL